MLTGKTLRHADKADNPVVPYTYWVQLQLPSTATLTGVAVQASAIHGGAMFIGAYHLRYCTDPLPAGGCAAWEHARNTTGGLAFAGPQGSGNLQAVFGINHLHLSTGDRAARHW